MLIHVLAEGRILTRRNLGVVEGVLLIEILPNSGSHHPGIGHTQTTDGVPYTDDLDSNILSLNFIFYFFKVRRSSVVLLIVFVNSREMLEMAFLENANRGDKPGEGARSVGAAGETEEKDLIRSLLVQLSSCLVDDSLIVEADKVIGLDYVLIQAQSASTCNVTWLEKCAGLKKRNELQKNVQCRAAAEDLHPTAFHNTNTPH